MPHRHRRLWFQGWNRYRSRKLPQNLGGYTVGVLVQTISRRTNYQWRAGSRELGVLFKGQPRSNKRCEPRQVRLSGTAMAEFDHHRDSTDAPVEQGSKSDGSAGNDGLARPGAAEATEVATMR